jgi:uncharacterized protein YraI
VAEHLVGDSLAVSDRGFPELGVVEACVDDQVGKEAHGVPTREPRRHEQFNLGDLVVVNRNNVNLRGWMATESPSLAKLSRGDRAVLLSAPYRFEKHYWVKVRLEQSSEVGYVSVRYLDLVESRANWEESTPEPTIKAHAPRERLQAGDKFTNSVQISIRTGPGVHHPIAFEIPRNSLGSALNVPAVSDSLAWVPARFPQGSGWIAAQHVRLFARQSKWIEVDVSRQELVAWDDDTIAFRAPVSSGKPGYQTPTDTFQIFRKIPVRRLRANLRGERWDIPGVPWLLAFKRGGFYIHSAYWHNDFGTPVSHGCVTLSVDNAQWLYDWTPVGTPIWIHQ